MNVYFWERSFLHCITSFCRVWSKHFYCDTAMWCRDACVGGTDYHQLALAILVIVFETFGRGPYSAWVWLGVEGHEGGLWHWNTYFQQNMKALHDCLNCVFRRFELLEGIRNYIHERVRDLVEDAVSIDDFASIMGLMVLLGKRTSKAARCMLWQWELHSKCTSAEGTQNEKKKKEQLWGTLYKLWMTYTREGWRGSFWSTSPNMSWRSPSCWQKCNTSPKWRR